MCVRPRRSLCRAPALSVSGPGAVCVSGPFAFCVSGPGALCRAAAVSVTGLSASNPVALFVGGLCRGPALARKSSPNALCVVARLSLSLCRAPALFVPGPPTPSIGACVGARRSSPNALCVGFRCSLLGSVSGPAVFSQRSRRSLCRSLCRGSVAARPSCVGARCSLGVRRCLSKPGALSVRPRLSLCRGPVLSVSGPGLSALCRADGAPLLSRCVLALRVFVCMLSIRNSDPCVTHPARIRSEASCHAVSRPTEASRGLTRGLSRLTEVSQGLDKIPKPLWIARLRGFGDSSLYIILLQGSPQGLGPRRTLAASLLTYIEF